MQPHILLNGLKIQQTGGSFETISNSSYGLTECNTSLTEICLW